MKKKHNEEHEDIVFEEDAGASENIGPDIQKKLKKAKDALKKCEAEKQEYLDGWQRSKAEFANLRKQDEKDNASLRKYAEQGLIEELIGVLDSFDMAMGQKESWESAPEEWRKGIEHIYSGFLHKLESRGLSRIDAKGRSFDPELHEAVQNVPVEAQEDDQTVVVVLQAGYRLHDRVIRHAKVQVGTHTT
jgi:molecular chaperone GrpE